MFTLHLVSHTHWDREWYLTFQQFRLKLVHLLDHVLALLASDPAFRFFMLDGQTIVLDDYLAMRPEREQEIRAHVQSGRLLIGPWYILPDEFLVSPEATIRNLLQGERTARRFGAKMPVGYLPDPFGHIGQMPQILRGFGIEAAALRRGLADEPCEVWWEAPDGSRVLLAYLRDGYDNAARLPTSEPERFVSEVRRLRDSLAPHTATSHLLLMHGTDHMEPPLNTTAALAYAQSKLDGDVLIHSTLPAYLAAIQAEIASISHPIPVLIGELRHPKRHHLLPGVLSTRMWIKQRNHACETLLEKWAEPFSAWVEQVCLLQEGGLGQGAWVATGHQKTGRIASPAPILRQAWRLLMECHPHDSICGCSIDQVHDEMRVRFDQVEQIGEEITRQSLEALSAAIDTRPPLFTTVRGQAATGHRPAMLALSNEGGGEQRTGNEPPMQATNNPRSAIIVFNATGGPRTDRVSLSVQLPAGVSEFEIVDETGNVLPHQVTGAGSREMANMLLDRNGLQSVMGYMQNGQVMGMVVRDAGFRREGDRLWIDIVMAEAGEVDMEAVQRGLNEIESALTDDTLNTFVIHAYTAAESEVTFVARDVPGYGYRVFWLRPASPPVSRGNQVANEFLQVQVADDGTLTVQDKRTGAIYTGLNRFVDGGDCGDEYNSCPPARDAQSVAEVQSVQVEYGEAGSSWVISLVMHVSASLTDDRQARCAATVPLAITTRATLSPGVPRLDVVTEVDNTACDHCLRVHFPAPFAVTSADYDGHFGVVRRPVGLPVFDESWVEQPRPESPQRAWTDLSNGDIGLMIANRGLPEVEVWTTDDRLPTNVPQSSLHGLSPISGMALTLLRCVGWLSRDDLPTRRGHAGPALPVPGAQMMGRHRFEYSIIPHAGDWRMAFSQAYAFAVPLRAVATSIHAGVLPHASAIVHVEPAGFVISAIKCAEDGNGLVVRGYNLGAEPIQVNLRPWRAFARAARVRLDETQEAELTQAADGSVTLTARGYEIVTVVWDVEGGGWSVERRAWSVERRAWSVERRAWSVERGAWSVERRAWSDVP